MHPNNFSRYLTLAFLIVASLLSACATSTQDTTNLKRIYDRSAQYHQPDRNPVIVIPGILGSRLVDDTTGMTVWGAFRRDYADPKTDDGARLIALPLSADLTYDHSHFIKTSVTPDGVLEDLKVDLAGIPISIQAYSGIFDIVAHSMGGILARYFAQYGAADLDTLQAGVVPWTGAKDLDRLILVAPPNAGSLEAVDQLLNGFNTGRPVLPFYHQALIGSFPSVYQLLPRARHQALVWDADTNAPVKDLLDPALWQRMKWGLSGEDEDTDEVLKQLMPTIDSIHARREVARRYQTAALNRARQFQAAMDVPAILPPGFEMFLVAGDSQETPGVGSVDTVTGEYSILSYVLGDETVTRSSALLDERVGQDWAPRVISPIKWSSTLFIPGKHRTITNGPIFEDNVLYWLLEDPRN